jgi:hypothetical protein
MIHSSKVKAGLRFDRMAWKRGAQTERPATARSVKSCVAAELHRPVAFPLLCLLPTAFEPFCEEPRIRRLQSSEEGIRKTRDIGQEKQN